jgi:hypothetical protein
MKRMGERGKRGKEMRRRGMEKEGKERKIVREEEGKGGKDKGYRGKWRG